jgi:hypothetical protein
MSGGRGLALLLVLMLLLVSQVGSHLVDAALLPFVAALLAAHIDRESGHLARAVVVIAARLIPARRREEECNEWLDHVDTAGEHGVLPLSRALSIAFFAAPLLAIGLRVGRSRGQSVKPD